MLMVLCCILIIDGGLNDQSLRLVDFFFADDMLLSKMKKQQCQVLNIGAERAVKAELLVYLLTAGGVITIPVFDVLT